MNSDAPASSPASNSEATSPELNKLNAEKPHARIWPPTWLPPVAIVIVVLLWPFISYGAAQAWRHSQNRVEDWLPEQLPETQGLVRFFERFGSDEFLMISWPDCVLGDPRASALEQLLVQPQEGGQRFFDQAQSGTLVLQSLIDDQRLSRADALARLAGVFVGPRWQADLCRRARFAL